MKRVKIKSSLKGIISMLLITTVALLPQLVMAQIGGGGGGDGTSNPDAPIDGGIGLLVAAGVGYGIKKTRDARMKKRMEEPKSEYAKQAEQLN